MFTIEELRFLIVAFTQTTGDASKTKINLISKEGRVFQFFEQFLSM